LGSIFLVIMCIRCLLGVILIIIIFCGKHLNNLFKNFLKFFGMLFFKGMPPKAAYLGKAVFQHVRSRMTFWESDNLKQRKFLGF
jgi:hypothetical protein